MNKRGDTAKPPLFNQYPPVCAPTKIYISFFWVSTGHNAAVWAFENSSENPEKIQKIQDTHHLQEISNDTTRRSKDGQRGMKGVSGEFALKKLREQPFPW